MISFRAEDSDAADVERWAQELHIDRSELLRQALRRHLAELAADHEVQAYAEQPMTSEETALAQVADWGPAEEWTDWADAAR
jgi:predicted ArsR family transcriptional regulator